MPAVMDTGCSLLIVGLHQPDQLWVGLPMTVLPLTAPLVVSQSPVSQLGWLRLEGLEAAAGWVHWDPLRPREKQQSW